jgi:hypothetical protein
MGLQMLKGFGAVEVCRRQWIIRRLVKEMGKIGPNSSGEWLVKKEWKMNHAVDDILELSSHVYFAVGSLQVTTFRLLGMTTIRNIKPRPSNKDQFSEISSQSALLQLELEWLQLRAYFLSNSSPCK